MNCSSPGHALEFRDLYERIAEYCKQCSVAFQRVVKIAKNGNQKRLQRITGIIRNLDQENQIIEFLKLPEERLQVLGNSLSEAIQGLAINRLPIDGGFFKVKPRPIPNVRAILFERSICKDSPSSVCTRLLQEIEESREHDGVPHGEPRHPNILIGKPWPMIAKVVWDASNELLRG